VKLSDRLITSDPLQKEAWIRVVSERETVPELFVLCVSGRASYTAEIYSTKELYKAVSGEQDGGLIIIGIADSYGAAVTLFQNAVEGALVRDPGLKALKNDLKELYA